MPDPEQNARTFKVEDVDQAQMARYKTQREQAQHPRMFKVEHVDQAQLARYKTQQEQANKGRELVLPKRTDK